MMKCEKCGAPLSPEDEFCIECGSIVNEFPPVQNNKLKEIIHELHENYSQNLENDFFNEINNASFLAPVDIEIDEDIKNKMDYTGEITFDKNTPINFMLISSEDGKNFLPAFTDEGEIAKDEVKKDAIIVKLDNYVNIINDHPDNIQGIAINPFGEVVIVPKNRIVE